MKRFREHIQNLVDPDKYGGLLEDIMIGLFFCGALVIFLWALAHSLGVL